MIITQQEKKEIKKKIIDNLCEEKEIQKIIIFGSFTNSDQPEDIDIAIIQNSNEKYLPLSLKYRKLVREISKTIPVDIVPLNPSLKGSFINEIQHGEIIYER